MIIMKIFSPSQPASAQKTQASPARSKHTRTALKNGRDTKTKGHVSFEQVCQPDSQVHQQSHLDSTLPPVSLAVQPGPEPGRQAKEVGTWICVSSGSRQKLPCCSLGRLAPRLQLPGPHHRIGVGSKICLAVNTDLQQHVSPCPCPARALPGFILPAISPTPVSLPSAAAPLAAPVRGASNMSVPHAEL